jgi:hypothetical protein
MRILMFVRKTLVAALVLASCAPVAAPARPEAPAAVPVPPPALQATTPENVSAAPCGVAAAGVLPVEMTCVEVVRRDLDGDGWPDALVILADAKSLEPGGGEGWRVRVALATGATYEVGFAAEPTLSGRSMIRGFVDVDRDGRDEALIELGRGASTEMIGVFGLGRSGLTQATYQDGTKARLLFAGSVRHGAAVECRSQAGRAELVMRGISNYTADDQWDWSESVYTWSAKVLVLSSQRKGSIKVAHPFDPPPNEEAYWSFRCFGLNFD